MSLFPQETAIDRFIFAVENEYYAEAHELLEDDWRDLKKSGQLEKSQVLKGLINGATALALYHKKKKPEGFKKVWPVFEKYIPLLEKIDFEEKEKYYYIKDLLIKLSKEVKRELA